MGGNEPSDDPIGLNWAATVVEKAGRADVFAALQEECARAERTLDARWSTVLRVAGALLASPIGTLDRDDLRAIVNAS
jgi:hypothetical protein